MAKLAPRCERRGDALSFCRRHRRCPVRVEGTPHGLVGTALIDTLNGEYQEPNIKLTLVRFWFVLGRAP